MNHQYKKPSKDANHDEILNHLRDHGYYCLCLASQGAGVADAIVWDNKLSVVMEIKTGASSKIYLSQLKFIAEHPGYVQFVQTKKEALEVVKNPERLCMSDKCKTAVLMIYNEVKDGFQGKGRAYILFARFLKRFSEIRGKIQ